MQLLFPKDKQVLLQKIDPKTGKNIGTPIYRSGLSASLLMSDTATKQHFRVVEKAKDARIESAKEPVKKAATIAPKEDLLLNEDGTPKTARQLIAELDTTEDIEFVKQLAESKFKTVSDKAKEKLEVLNAVV